MSRWTNGLLYILVGLVSHPWSDRTMSYGEELRRLQKTFYTVLNKEEDLRYGTMKVRRAHGLLTNSPRMPRTHEAHFVT
ncbi:hypothetical protein BKA83DRAFT_4161827 [Pisolithus microcarpus]|nr:hypothetical protein BKA83DRAFT_4161827 [Pisolithus microcarpus]